MPEIYWVDDALGFRVAILARPRGGSWLADEARELKANGVDIVVSFLTPDEERELALEGEREAMEAQGMKYISFPIEDCGTPASMSGAQALIGELLKEMKSGKAMGYHCRASIGRSPMIAAAVLAASGIPVDRALMALSEARGWQVPETDDQRRWIDRFLDSLKSGERPS